MNLNIISRLRKRSVSNNKQVAWDKQYSAGNWEILKSPLEDERFDAVNNVMLSFANNASILEIGCGEGLLQAKMEQRAYAEYVGIDISAVAIKSALRHQNKSTKYLHANMEVFTPRKKFDIIIFTESIYYSDNPVLLFTRYLNFLRPGGRIITSIYETDENLQVINDLQALYQPVATKVTVNERGKWYCDVYHFN